MKKLIKVISLKLKISLSIGLLLSTIIIIIFYSEAGLYTNFSFYILGRTITGILVFAIALAMTVYMLYSLIESIIKFKNGTANNDTILNLFFFWIIIAYFFMYDFQNFLEKQVFSNAISDFPSFVEFIGIIATILIPFILLKVSNSENDKRENNRLSLEHQILLSPKFKWSQKISISEIVKSLERDPRDDRTKIMNEEFYEVTSIQHAFDGEENHSNEAYDVLFKNIGNSTIKIHLCTIETELIDIKNIQKKKADNDEIVIIPKNGFFILLIGINEHKLYNTRISFEAENILGERLKCNFIYQLQSHKFTIHSSLVSDKRHIISCN